jgi:hypothetical protein
MLSLLLVTGLILIAAGQLMLLVRAFGVGIHWAVGTLLFPLQFGALFVATHWHQAKRPFLLWIAGMVLLFLAARSM